MAQNRNGNLRPTQFSVEIAPETKGVDDLSKKLRLLQDQLISLEKSAVRVGNSLAGNSPTSKKRFTTFDQVLANDASRTSSGMKPLGQMSPEMQSLIDAIKALTKHIGDTRRNGAEPAADPADFMTPSQRLASNAEMQRRQLKASEDQVKALNRANEAAQKRAERETRISSTSADPTSRRAAFERAQMLSEERRRWAAELNPETTAPGRPLSTGERIANSVLSARSLSMLGALGTGNAGPLAGSLIWRAVGSGGTATSSGSGILGKLLGTSAPPMSEATGGVAGVASRLPLIGGLIASGVSAAIAAIEYIRIGRTQAGKYQEGLLASIGGLTEHAGGIGPTGGTVTPHDAWSMIMDKGARYLYDPNTAYDTARQLGQAGIQFGGGNRGMASALETTLGFARRANIDPSAAADLTSVLMVQGRRTADEVSRMFQVMEKQAAKTGIPIARLVDSFKQLETSTGGVGTSLLGVAGLATVQQMVGPGVNAGSLMAPLAGATGAHALAMSAMLGLSPDQFMAHQGNPAALFDDVGKFLRKAPGANGAKTSTASIMVFEEMLQQSGLMGLMGVDPKDQFSVVQKLLSGDSAGARAQSLLKSVHLESPTDYNKRMAGLANELVTDPERLKLSAQYLAAGLDNANNYLGSFDSAVSDAAASLRKLANYAATGLPGYKPVPQPTPGIPTGAHWTPGTTVGFFDKHNKQQTMPVTKGMYDMAVAASAATGVPLSVLLAQMAQEGALGNKVTTRKQLTDMGMADMADYKRTGSSNWGQALAMYHEGADNYAKGIRGDMRGWQQGQVYGKQTDLHAHELNIILQGKIDIDATGKASAHIPRQPIAHRTHTRTVDVVKGR